MRISDIYRNQLIKTVDENELENIDFSPFLAIGFSQQDIGVIIKAVRLLRYQPYLPKKELIREGLTEKQISNILGGIDNFKNQLNIQEYSFNDWLMCINHNEGDNICLPYWVYQHFFSEISQLHMKLLQLKCWIKVEVNGIQLREFILPNQTTSLIPATDRQTAELLINIWSQTNELLSYDEKTSVLLFINIETGSRFSIEARSQSSSFNSQTNFGFCIEDDQQNTRLPKSAKIITAYDLIERIKNVG